MPARPITDPVTGESLAGTEPQLQQQTDPGWWRQRLNLYTGRTLTVSALDSEQKYRSGLLASLGQAVTAGTVSGLALTMNTSGADPVFTVSPGYGIMANGQDVVLNTTLKTTLSGLTVIDSVTGTDLYTFHQLVGDLTNHTYAGILLLQPVIAQVSGQQLDTGSLPTIVSGNLGASCNQDPAEYAFEDWQIADAVRLVYLPWPAGISGATNLQLPPLQPPATWRNRLAYAIFEAEAVLGPDDQLPWATLGVPVALIAFDPGIAWAASTPYSVGDIITDPNSNIQKVTTAGTSNATPPATWNTAWGGSTTDGAVTWVNSGLAWKPLFVDCSAVVRAGGLPRNRYMLPSQPAPLLQWQPQTAFGVKDFVIDPNNNVQVVTTAGTTGLVPPQWKTTNNQTTTDGTVVWTNNGSATWSAKTVFSSGQFVFDESGNQQQVFNAGTSGSDEPDWNGIYLPTKDGTVVWINNGTGNPPVVQPALAQARINQLSEQLGQVMAARQPFTTLADIFPTLPPSGILPASAVNFADQTAPWLPPNWTISAGPVFLEELETVLETGMLMDPISALTAAPADTDDLEPVEILVPLPDAVYDPNILVVDTVPQIFYQEVARATQARNLTLQRLETVQQEINTLFTAIGPNVPANPNLIDPENGLTPDELAGRDAPPPYTPTAAETFGTVLQSTWQPSTSFSANQFVIDGNGSVQITQGGGTTGSSAPDWSTVIGQTTTEGVTWLACGKATWLANQSYATGQFILDSGGNIQQVQIGGTSASAPPTWATSVNGATVEKNAITWTNKGRPQWQPSFAYKAGDQILDPNNNIQVVVTGGTSASSAPSWNPLGTSTADSGVTWTNLGYPTWQADTAYSANAAILDANGNIQAVSTAGISGSSAPQWNPSPGQTTQDGLTWTNQGKDSWTGGTSYSVGALVLDSNNSIQQAQTAGTSGSSANNAHPAWSETVGTTTSDTSITWLNNGPFAWQPNSAYIAGQFVVDPSGYMQMVTAPGSSGASQPNWIFPASDGSTTSDGKVTWAAHGKQYWHPAQTYSAGQTILDANGNLQSVTTGGASGATVPLWDPNLGQPTQDGAVVWNNLGKSVWQPNTQYNPGQAILDSMGGIQVASAGGLSGTQPPTWPLSKTTTDGIVWQSGSNVFWKAGTSHWQPNYLYASGQLIFDKSGNIQIVQTGGISGDSEPSWNANIGQTTQDGAVVWNNLGRTSWQPNTTYSTGQAIVDSNGGIQTAIVGGISGTGPGINWAEGANSITFDSSLTWTRNGSLTWQANTQYPAGQIIIDSNGNLQYTSTLGQSGSAQPAWNTNPTGTTSDGKVTWTYLAYCSSDLLQIRALLAGPSCVINFTDNNGNSHTISLLSPADLTNFQTNGLQALITSLNARISQANDLLDTGFLTAQTDIYRFRNYILGAAAATTLATSPVLANIATGETASATAENLQNYLGTLLPSTGATTTTTTTTGGSGGAPGTTTSTTTTQPPIYKPPIFHPISDPVVLGAQPVQLKFAGNVFQKVASVRSMAVHTAIGELKSQAFRIGGAAGTIPIAAQPTQTLTGQAPTSIPVRVGTSLPSPTFFRGASEIGTGLQANLPKFVVPRPAQIVTPGQNVPATTTDITGQSPLPGAQVNIRTLTIAQRLAQSPSQEAMFYAISNRLTFLQTLQTLENDLNLVADDLPILVDDLPTTPPTVPGFVPVVKHTFSEFLGPNSANIMTQIQSPNLVNDASEGTIFSVGVRVVEQHTMLLRALEARVQQYSDFVAQCTNALQNMQNNIQQAQSYITQLTNNLSQQRQNLAFTSALLADQVQLVQTTNAQRQQVLATVQLVAFTRARTLEAVDTVPSRQLVPANVTNPVPACLQQSVAIPPELREIVGQLREAPVSWLPSASLQVSNLERPVLLQELALNTQARAAQLLQLPQLPSSAVGEAGTYASSIAGVYSANQRIFRSYQTQRATLQPAALSNLSWIQQVASLQSIAAVNDLISANSVHTEVSNAVARLIQQISSVATCLYTRVSIAQPIDRLTWADYLTGNGASVQLQSLAILPGWNQLSYADRQQMQMLVDWLFLQIDTTSSAATAFMSDVVRTAVLLASDVPVDNIISGNIIARVQPVINGTVSLSLTSERIASGMYVNLYSGATLAARGVVRDLDSSTVRATVTDVFQPGAYLETTDTAHFTTLTPQAVALRPLFMQS